MEEGGGLSARHVRHEANTLRPSQLSAHPIIPTSTRTTNMPTTPASTGAAVADDTPGTSSYASPAAASAAASLLTREKVLGQPPLSRTTDLPCVCVVVMVVVVVVVEVVVVVGMGAWGERGSCRGLEARPADLPQPTTNKQHTPHLTHPMYVPADTALRGSC